MKRLQSAAPSPRRRPGCGWPSITIAVISAGLLLLGQAAAPATSTRVHALPKRQAEPLCLMMTTLDGAPDRVLAGETFDVELVIRSLCSPRTFPLHVVVAVALMPGVEDREHSVASRNLRDVIDGLGQRIKNRLRVGVAIPSERGDQTCPLHEDLGKAKACVQRLEHVEPRGSDALDRAVAAGLRTLAPRRIEGDEGPATDVLLVIVVDRERTAGLRPMPKDRADCSKAVRRIHQRRATRRLVVFTGPANRYRPLDRDLEACLSRLTWGPGYGSRSVLEIAPNVATTMEPPGFRGEPGLPIRRVKIRFDIPSALELVSASSSAWPNEIAVDGHSIEFQLQSFYADSIDFRLRALSPGRTTLTGTMALEWEERGNVYASMRRPPLGDLLVLMPRRLPPDSNG